MSRKATIDTSKVTANLFKTAAVADKEAVPFRDEPVRTAAQRMLDEQVKALHEKWVEKGKPEFTRSQISQPNSGIPRNVTHFAPENAPAIKKMLEQAGNFRHVTVVMSTLRAHQDGSAMYYWAVRDPQERATQKRICPVCDSYVSVRADGKLRTHGPRDARCPGGAPPSSQTNGSGPDDEVETG
jgi:hypothetical protein